ncbi:MAG: hypothetical protein K0Q72_2953 [Armatimonadetes bacterium]|jgi:hypothetical protein|nr:hypothetical protein [Armatimonadota bacterium]
MNAKSASLPVLLFSLVVAAGQASAHGAVAAPPSEAAELLSVRKIWDASPHNAFTDLIRWKGSWYCVFREGKAHVSPDGSLQVLTSKDGDTWTSAARITDPRGDLRDAKITVTPDKRLMLSGAIALPAGAPYKHQSLAWFSKNGTTWSEPAVIGDPNMWLWRTTWNRGTAYSVGYGTAERRFTRLYRSKDGAKFEPVVENLFDRDYPNEHSLVFLKDGTAYCLLRRDQGTATGQLGESHPPYTDWTWKDLGKRIGGPQMLRLPDGRFVAAVRLHDGKVRTGLCWLDPATATLTEFLPLPSGGDCSYAGLVWHDKLLWVSYYSSHEGKTSIYLAKVKLPKKG